MHAVHDSTNNSLINSEEGSLVNAILNRPDTSCGCIFINEMYVILEGNKVENKLYSSNFPIV